MLTVPAEEPSRDVAVAYLHKRRTLPTLQIVQPLWHIHLASTIVGEAEPFGRACLAMAWALMVALVARSRNSASVLESFLQK